MGEEFFRAVERSLLQEFSQRDGCVISLGGGTIAIAANLQLVKSSGILVYLKIHSDQIFQRLKYKTDRPLLRSPSGTMLPEEELRGRIAWLLALREPFYTQADITVLTDDRRVGMTVDEIVRRLSLLGK